jgi:hypothetical protein
MVVEWPKTDLPAGCPAPTRTFFVDRKAEAGGDGSFCTPFKTVQEAMGAIGAATTLAEFNDADLRAWRIVVAPGVYTENVAAPLRPDITLELVGAVIVGNLTMTFDFAPFTAGPMTQVKLKIVGADLRSAFQPNAGTQMSINGIDGNIEFIPSNAGSVLFIQLHLINTGVTGTPGAAATPPTGTGHIKTSSTPHTCQVFCENAMVKGDFFIPAGAAGTLYAANMDTSSSASFGGVRGQINLNVIRNVRFLRPVVVNSTHGRWFNTDFASGQAHDFTGSSGAIRADANSFNSYSDNIPTKGTETFTLIDTPRFLQILAADPTANAGNRARFWYNSIDRQVKAVADDGVGGFEYRILG